SFFGSSHVSVRLQEARSSSDIYFRLRTRRADSMLFLAAGRTDYCLLVLDAGRLKVHINLGAGETEIASEAPFLLNDMKWHAVNLTRRGSQLTIQVDSHLTKANLPVRFHELNIHFGIWLGGLAGFNEIFLGNLPSFRGCMSHITYNQEDVLLRAKTQPGQVSGITWNCSDEFDAGSSDPFSLVSPTSYVISRVAISRGGTTVKLNVRPYENDGLVFYVSGMSSRPDYLALELRDGKPRFVAEMGSGPMQVESSINTTDLHWHDITLQVSPTVLSLTVDNQSWTSESPARGASRHLDVSEMVYLGVEETKRSRLRSQGLIDHSFRGCVRNLLIDNKAYGLPEVDVTNNVTTGCVLTSSTNQAPGDCTLTSSASSGSGKKRFNCTDHTSGGASSRNNGTQMRGSNSSEVITIARDVIRIVTQTALGELEVMRVSPVQVAEGDSVIITPRHLAITLDLSKFGVRESGVLFRVSKGPQQGRLEVTTRAAGSAGSARTLETFSLLDVGAGRVRYWHNGAESTRDLIELVLRLVPMTGFLLPAYLQDERPLALPVEITAVNDPPEIRLVPGGVLRLAEGTKIRLMPEVITSLDPDTRAEDLIFSLMSMGTAAEKKGYLELSTDQGNSIQSFSQADLQAGRVWYVDQGLSSSKMALKVTDGSSVSQTALLRIETFSLRIAPEVNSGLEVANVMGTAALISSSNLSFTSNAQEQGLVVEYHVVNGPRAGALQLRRTNGQWTTTEHFTQLDLHSGRVRYLLQKPSDIPTEDEFTFHVSLSEVKVPSEFRFRLRIVPLRVEQVGSNSLRINGTESQLTPSTLFYRTTPMPSSDKAVTYLLVTPPRFGHLFFSGQNQDSPAVTFTQSDILNGQVLYKFKYTPQSSLEDFFLLNVTTSQLSTLAGPFRIDISHQVPAGSKSPILLSVKPLLVKEGGREVLSKKVLSIRINDSNLSLSKIFFNVTSKPSHGALRKETDSGHLSPLEQFPEHTFSRSAFSKNAFSRNTFTRNTFTGNAFSGTSFPENAFPEPPLIEQFSWLDIDKGKIVYEHDGGESPRDKVGLVGWSAEGNIMFIVDIDVMVGGVNNHQPQPNPKSSMALSVVMGGMKRITKDTLDFLDEDWDSNRSGLRYSTKGSVGKHSKSPMGNIYDRSGSLSKPIFSWTQADIDAGKLVFKHEGSDTAGTLPFWVTDNTFTVNGTVRISAGSPTVRVVNTSRLAGKRGSMARLTEESIGLETNVDVDEGKILIRILDGPQHGIIRVNETGVRNFTLGDMAQGLVSYQNQGTTDAQQDAFHFRAVVQGVAQSEDTYFEVAIYPEAYWAPLSVGANGSVVVNENSSAVISQTSLQISNAHIPPNHIVYTLTRPPKHGYLAVDPSPGQDGKSEDADDYVTMWDQTVINTGRLRYIQSEPNKTHDSMEFDVTNGVQTLRDLRLDFIVVPTTLLLASAPVFVNEGSTIALNLTHLHAAQNYFADKLSEVRITSGPEHGTLTMISRPKSPLHSFPYKALQDGKIFYTHDGSETLEDQFTVIAQTVGDEKGGGNLGSRTSLSHRVPITIIPANDQIPRVVNNTGNWVWAGSSVPISSAQLAAADEDSDANQLVFYIVGTRGGYPAFQDQPDVPLQNFTQAMINNSQIIFVHKGEDLKPAWFEFELSDGLNEAAKEGFNVSVKKPELLVYDGRVPLPVFPLTQSPLKPENLLVRSSDGREITFQITTGPSLGQILMEQSQEKFVRVSTFTQSDVNNGKILYQHTKVFKGQRGNDSLRFSVTSRYADPLDNVTLEIDVSVSGAALGGLQRYVSIQPLMLKEGTQVTISSANVNLTAIKDFISMQQRGNIWRSGETPVLKLVVVAEPRHGKLTVDGNGLNKGAEISLDVVDRGSLRYGHDDSETTQDLVELSLWLWTLTGGSGGGGGGGGGKSSKEEAGSSTWLVNVTLPVHITPVNDQPFHISSPKGPILAVVQEHWRKLSRNDLLTSDADTPPAHIVYEVSKISHGRFVLLSSTDSMTTPMSSTTTTTSPEPDQFKALPTALRFTQADVDAGKVIFYHSGPVSPVLINLKVSDGHFPAAPVSLTVPVQAISLQASQSQAAPIRIQQGNNLMSLSLMNLPASTNGHLTRLVYNITRLPLHGKVLLQNRNSSPTTFTHYELLRGELSYVQTDIHVSNDSFEVKASFRDMSRISTSWLVNVVTVPLLKRVKEVRSFVKGFAVGGILAPDEAEFSASSSLPSVLNLAVLDASPLAAITGANPVYEIILPPKFGILYKVPYRHIKGQFQQQLQLPQQQRLQLPQPQRLQQTQPQQQLEQDQQSQQQQLQQQRQQLELQNVKLSEQGQELQEQQQQLIDPQEFHEQQEDEPKELEQVQGEPQAERLQQHLQQQLQVGRVANRFSHEDVRRGSIIYYPSSADVSNNEIIPFRYSVTTSSASSSGSSSSMSMSIADEFVFKVLAPGVQPALGIAKFNIRDDAQERNRLYDEKIPNQIISDGSTDPATKRSGSGSSMRDITLLVTPHMTKDSLITIAIVVAGIVTLSLFLIVGIRCTCSKTPPEPPRRPVGSLNNGCSGADPKCISNGIIDAYVPSTLDPCNSDSDTGTTAALRPLMMSTLSPRQSRHCHGSHHGHHSLKHGASNRSDSGSWTSCSASAGMPTPSIPQCRVTPLCAGSGGGNSSDSGGGYSGSNSLMMCPLLPPTPICDTFAPLPEEIDPPEPYGFTYGSITSTLLPPPLDLRDVTVEETGFNDGPSEGDPYLQPPHHHHHHLQHHPGPASYGHHSNSMGTLRSNSTMERQKQQSQGKSQYWV
ncbi:unnamed protein product, partial [Allacma fusca]